MTALDLSVEQVRQRLAQPGAASLPGDWESDRSQAELRPASVLVAIVARPELTVLFTQRCAGLRSHSGQISFPGGRAEPADESPEFTALRETHEEIGLEPARVEVLGRLPDYLTRTGYRVTPVVGAVVPPIALRPDPREVEEVFEVPLAFLLDPANHQRQSRELAGRTAWFYAIPYQERYIWGATAGMLVNFYRQLAGVAPSVGT